LLEDLSTGRTGLFRRHRACLPALAAWHALENW